MDSKANFLGMLLNFRMAESSILGLGELKGTKKAVQA